MSRTSKKVKEENEYYTNPNGRIEYNELCRKCKRDCKQSYRSEIVVCPIYESKRALGDWERNTPIAQI